MSSDTIAHYDIKREIQKRADRAAKALPLRSDDAAKELFLEIVSDVTSDLREGQVVTELNDHFSATRKMGKTPSLTDINTSVNRTFKRVINWSKRHKRPSEEERDEFTRQIKVAVRSFCRKFDRQATCWRS